MALGTNHLCILGLGTKNLRILGPYSQTFVLFVAYEWVQ